MDYPFQLTFERNKDILNDYKRIRGSLNFVERINDINELLKNLKESGRDV